MTTPKVIVLGFQDELQFRPADRDDLRLRGNEGSRGMLATMNNFKVENPRENLQFEIDFTTAHRAVSRECSHPAELETCCLRAKSACELEKGSGSAKHREDLHDVLTYWKGRSTNSIVLNRIPEKTRRAVFSDEWRTMPLPASRCLRSRERQLLRRRQRQARPHVGAKPRRCADLPAAREKPGSELARLAPR